MKKIPTVFIRDPDTKLRYVRDEVHPACGWVLAGEGVATRKYDGTCCLVREGRLWKRYEQRPGKPAPADFEAIETDPNTGKTVGWVPVGDGPEDRWHREAFGGQEPDGTYELCGPKVQGNPEGLQGHILIAHASAQQVDAPRDFDGLRAWLADCSYEGIVWHHPDGRMAKLKRRDFPPASEPRKP